MRVLLPQLLTPLLITLLTVLLSGQITGCSPLTRKPNSDSWTLSGKIGITTPKESAAGFIRWQQQLDNFDIYVSGPLGQGSTRIQGNPQQATLTQGGKTSESLNPQQLVYQQLGWFFPLQNLPFWLQGKQAPFSTAHTTSKDGRLSEIKQDRWTVELLRYHSYHNLPERIKIRQGDWKFLIVVKNWSVD
ncbi:MAG: lipoprotein insertase outer membrane protein LolB [Bermanella sp.]